MKVLELFGGIGACTQALKRLHVPLEIADYVEIDKYAVKSYNAINGTNFEPQDITKWDKNLEVDLIMHGSPCQDFSIAGKQAGADEGSGTRSSLMYETVRIVTKLKPKYVIWENVKNVLSAKHRHNFEAYLEKMESLGYENYYQVLNAKDYEIPQNRERIFTVSILNSGGFEFPLKKELKTRLKDVLEDEVDEKNYLSDEQVERIKTSTYVQNTRRIQGKDWCDTLYARVGHGVSQTLQCNDSMGVVTAAAMCGRYNEGKIEQHIEVSDREYSNALTTVQKDSLIAKTKCLNSKVNGKQPHVQDRIYDSEGISPAITTAFRPSIAEHSENLRIRKLTPKECWRLMGFSNECFEKAQKVNSNTQLYKQAGNSIVVDVLYYIFKNLLRG